MDRHLHSRLPWKRSKAAWAAHRTRNGRSKKMNINLKRAALLGSFAFSLIAFASPASAQWNVTGIGVAEYDTEETLLLLAGVSAGPGGPGWTPLVGVQTYYLTYKLPAETESVFSVRPYAG